MAETSETTGGGAESSWQPRTCGSCGYLIDNPDDNEDCPSCGEPLDED